MENTIMKSLTLGVEIEFTGITRTKAASIVADFFGTQAHKALCSGPYDTREIKDDEGRKWKVMRDSSIDPRINPKGHCGSADLDDYKVELVTPILTYKDIENLQQIVRDLRHAGGCTNRSCGIHVHIGADKFTPASLRTLTNIFAAHEDLIYKAMQVDDEHRNVDYCRKTSRTFLKKVNEQKPKTKEALSCIWYGEHNYHSYHPHYDSSRYRGLNLHAFFTKGTVEFRLFNSTLHAGKVKSYIQFCLALAQQALTQKRATWKAQETDNEKYAFRCWMLRLGLIGDEFKTCRKFFLEHLDGNSAWRHGAPQHAAA